LKLEDKLIHHREIKSTGYITPCWLWTLHTVGKGYGEVRDYHTNKLVHRVAAELWLPDFKSFLSVLHKCDIPRCFNPEHLFQGTQKDNVRDSVVKGRHKEVRKTHCAQGHEFSLENTIRWKNKRICRICRDKRNRKVSL
jgi:hypothetical protein